MDNAKNKRIEWIDVAKCIGIILVIVSHKILRFNNMTEISRGLLFSFHMPLFFMLSAYTCRWSKSFTEFKKKSKKRFIHLIIPYYIAVVLLVIFDLIMVPERFTTGEYWFKNIDRLFCIAGEGHITNGAAWFFPCLFLLETIFDLIQLTCKDKRLILIICFLLTVLGIGLGRHNYLLPFMFDIVLSSMIFFYFGDLLKRIDFLSKSWIKFIICVLIWIILFFIIFDHNKASGIRYYEAVARNYPYLPLCYIAAIAGAMSFIYLSYFISKIKCIRIPFAWLGRNTLVVVIVHSIESQYYRKWFKGFISDNILLGLFSTVICLLASVLVILIISLIKKLLNKKRETLYPNSGTTNEIN